MYFLYNITHHVVRMNNTFHVFYFSFFNQYQKYFAPRLFLFLCRGTTHRVIRISAARRRGVTCAERTVPMRESRREVVSCLFWVRV
jgi:hypothetical protein